MKPRRFGPDADLEEHQEGRGRSELRRIAKGFDDLALELVALSTHRYKGLPLTAPLKQALEQARNTTSNIARRRHVRHLAGLLREAEREVQAIRAYLEGKPFVPVKGDESYRDLIAVRDALCDPETHAAALERARRQLPHLDVALVERLAAEWQATKDDKSYRALYKELNRALEELEQAKEDEEENG